MTPCAYYIRLLVYYSIFRKNHTCDALDCIYTEDPYEVKINKKVNYKGIDMTVRDINPYTAYKCANIRKAYIDINGSTGDNAFSGCTNLVSVDIKAGNSIGTWAFSACSSLKNFTFGSGLQSIGQEAFSDCINIAHLLLFHLLSYEYQYKELFCKTKRRIIYD